MAEKILTFAPIPSNPRFRDLTGSAFGLLTVIGFGGMQAIGRDRTKGYAFWWCRCKCAKATVVRVRGSNLRTGMTKSCGCQHAQGHVTHGQSRKGRHSPMYQVWAGMIARCYYRKHRGFADYGGRGITVCNRWRDSFASFLADMGERPTSQHCIDRIDNSRGYSPENCRWATRIEQARNKRNNRRLTFAGETKSLAAWAEQLRISPGTLSRRILLGWSARRALMTPVSSPLRG